MAHRNFQENKTTKQPNGMKIKIPKLKLFTSALGLALLGILASAHAADKKPNIIVIMGDDIGQFGKNHLGALNEFLPTVHGFDEFFGYLYHLDAMSDPFWYSFPTDPAIRAKLLPRNLVHSWATDVDDPTIEPRWGKIGK